MMVEMSGEVVPDATDVFLLGDCPGTFDQDSGIWSLSTKLNECGTAMSINEDGSFSFANDIESECALGCQEPTPGNDPASTEVNDEEAPDDDEEFEQAEEVNFEVEFLLDDGSTDNQTDEEAAAEIQAELLAIYDEMNPFEDGETTVEVTIEEIE